MEPAAMVSRSRTDHYLIRGGASPLLITGHRQVISRINKGSQNILIYNLSYLINITFDCPERAEVFCQGICPGTPWCGTDTVPYLKLILFVHWTFLLRGLLQNFFASNTFFKFSARLLQSNLAIV